MSAEELSYDAVIIGTGIGGLVAAIRAHDCGIGRIVVLEATQYLGGTTAVSAGGIWVPKNSHMPKDADSTDDARTYMSSFLMGKKMPKLLESNL